MIWVLSPPTCEDQEVLSTGKASASHCLEPKDAEEQDLPPPPQNQHRKMRPVFALAALHTCPEPSIQTSPHMGS